MDIPARNPDPKSRFALGAGALLVGSGLNYFGDRLLGVTMELFHGLATFSFAWMLDVFVLPFLVGLVVAWIYGLGGKWLCYFPPLIVRCIAYAQLRYLVGVPPGESLIPMGWWGFFVILAMEAAAIGGVIGEVATKRTYGRSSAKPPQP